MGKHNESGILRNYKCLKCGNSGSMFFPDNPCLRASTGNPIILVGCEKCTKTG